MEKFKSWLSVVLLTIVTGVMLLTLRPAAAPALPNVTIEVSDDLAGAPITNDSIWLVSQRMGEDGTVSMVAERHLFSDPSRVAQTITLHRAKK